MGSGCDGLVLEFVDDAEGGDVDSRGDSERIDVDDCDLIDMEIMGS